MSKKRAGAFFDRDGVICSLVGADQARGPRTLEELVLVDGAKNCLRYFSNQGFVCLVATNQPDISRNLLSLEDHEAINGEISHLIPDIQGFYTCPHNNSDKCSCRKPSPGLLLKAIDDFNIDSNRSFFVGDSWTDVLAAKNAGILSVLIEGPGSWRNTSQGSAPSDLVPDLVVKSIQEIEFLFSR